MILPLKYDYINFFDRDVFDYVLQCKKRELILVNYDGNSYILDLKTKNEIKLTDNNQNSYGSCEQTSTFVYCSSYSEDYSKKNLFVYNLITEKSKVFNNVSILDYKFYSNYMKIKNNNTEEYYNTNLEKFYEE